jgi:hypothetical protein
MNCIARLMIKTGRFGGWAEQRTAEYREPQNHEGWNRYALSFKSIEIDYLPSIFDIIDL